MLFVSNFLLATASWLAAVYLFFTTVGAFSIDRPMAGAVLVFATALLVPPIRKRLVQLGRTKLKLKYLSGFYFVLIAVLLVFLAATKM
ncbi:hypothetical protein ACFBZI_10975 [Moraxella sp. ZJ142]|uniref:hypothetical protein n=1 Tax=Moraxella marmotae TaxID=3344520 RepID=UPI0035D4303D